MSSTQVGLTSTKRHHHQPKFIRPFDVLQGNLTTGLDSRYIHDPAYQHQPLPRLQVRESAAGRGLGLFAIDQIPAYTKLVEDESLLSLKPGEDLPELWQKYRTLPPDHQQTFNELSTPNDAAAKEATLLAKLSQQRGYTGEEAAEMTRVSSRFQANAFKTLVSSSEDHQPWAYALFPTIARINHSCAPNAHTHYRPASGAQLVYTLRTLEPGEEVEISYFDVTMAFADRRARAEAWGFRCACFACRCSEDYERDLAVVRDGVHGSSSALEAAVGVAEAEERYAWLVVALPVLYQRLALLLTRMEKSDEARRAMENAIMWEGRITGVDGPLAEQRRRALRMS